MNAKFLEVYVSDQGVSKDGRLKAGTHLAFDENFINSRTAMDQYQIVLSCIQILEEISEKLAQEVEEEAEFFVNEADKAMEKLWESLNLPKK